MFLAAYLFALVLGGTLLGASSVLGGHADADADADVAALDGGDGDLDAHPGADHDAADHADHADPTAAPVGDLVQVAQNLPARRRRRRLAGLFSLRFWTFFAAFFGLTGVTLEGLGLAPALPGLIAALLMGTTAGGTATAAFRRLGASTTGVAAASSDYLGKSGRVLVPIHPGGLGKIRMTLRGTTVDVLAATEAESIDIGEHALVIEMRDTTAIVVRQPALAADRADP